MLWGFGDAARSASQALPPLPRAFEARVVGTTRTASFKFSGSPVDVPV